MTTYDKITKELINQANHYNRDDFHGSRVKAPTWKNMISAVELRHSHPCSAKKAVQYNEYKELTMHVKCMIEDNDEVEIRPNKTFLVLANEAGGRRT
ncbi:hypothetical protein Ahy_A09g043490 isoform B [Arachis hypogaea]|uniref:Uncharacterized protein n=1 Tax=Arachis hypogaea TaxID=3818 RepID=A0A445BIE7_ARAHY|nr:hypothetical protein Ahy_A09g043490 isoform B [Arachis hypogaea]